MRMADQIVERDPDRAPESTGPDAAAAITAACELSVRLSGQVGAMQTPET